MLTSHTDVGVSATTWQDLAAQPALISFTSGKVHDSQYKIILLPEIYIALSLHPCGLKFRVLVNEITLSGRRRKFGRFNARLWC